RGAAEMLARLFYLCGGMAFGYVLILSGVSNYDVMRDMFLLKSPHLYGVLAVAVVLSFAGVHILRAFKVRSFLNGEPITVVREKPDRGHIVGGLLAGSGWALTGACPGPALAQIGFGTL